MNENVIEWLTGDDTIAVTFSQLKWVNKIRRLSENEANNITILRENPDGSIFARLPISCLRISPKTIRNISEQEKILAAERLREGREKRRTK